MCVGTWLVYTDPQMVQSGAKKKTHEERRYCTLKSFVAPPWMTEEVMYDRWYCDQRQRRQLAANVIKGNGRWLKKTMINDV